MTGERVGEFPAGKGREAGVTVARAALGVIPVGGPAAAEFFGASVLARLREDQADWCNDVATKLNFVLDKIEDGPVDFQELVSDAAFRSVFAAAYQSALKTAFEEKLEALANAIANSVSSHAPDEHDRFVFVQYVDDLQPAHLRLLRYAANPTGWYERVGLERDIWQGPRSAALEGAFPEWSKEFWSRIAQDLDQRGLIAAGNLGGMVSENAVWQEFVTEYGRQFLAFISPPAE